MNNNSIGILDSGVGGLTVWKEIIAQLPHESTIYIGDSVNCPYGNKSAEEIYQLANRLVQFLIDKHCKLIVIACNTITVTCLDKLRQNFPQTPIIGTVPVIKTAAARSKNKKIGILSTTTTAKSEYQKTLIKQFAADCEVVNIGTDELVPIIEQQVTCDKKQVDTVLKRVLEPFKRSGVDVLALGCTHFPFFKEEFQTILGSNVLILDSGAAIARQVTRVLTANSLATVNKAPEYQFFTTGERLVLTTCLRQLGHKVRDYQVSSV